MSQALETAESIDGYRAACAASPLNAAAREGQRYVPTFLDPPLLKKLYKCMFEVPITQTMNVVVLDPTAENGYPHTRANSLICMPTSVVESSSPEELRETLCHEAIHVHQRRNPELWKSICVKEGWTSVAAERLPREFVERCRLNPDTLQQRFWGWQSHYVPMPLFIREDQPTMGEVQIKWLDTRYSTLFTDPPPSFAKRYGTPSQPEHPFELLAVEGAAARLYTDDLLRANLNSF